ncbi:hypothetical protein [Gillisia lutea]|nr:hypothetical protein [Gillisia lutea]
MATLENIIQNYNVLKEGDLTHRRHFMNLKSSTRESWYNRRRYGV